jgi:hypothetical protein
MIIIILIIILLITMAVLAIDNNQLLTRHKLLVESVWRTSRDLSLVLYGQSLGRWKQRIVPVKDCRIPHADSDLTDYEKVQIPEANDLREWKGGHRLAG